MHWLRVFTLSLGRVSYIDFNQRKWVRNRVWSRSFFNNQSLLPVYKSSFQIAAIFENLLKDFNRDFIRFQILKNFTVQLSRLRFTTADEWDGKGDIVRDAAIFENFEGLKITHDQTIVLIPFVEFHPQIIIRCDKIFDENGPISMT